MTEPHPPTDDGPRSDPEFRSDPELEAALREQPLHALPLALVARVMREVLPVQPLRPMVVVARTAAAILVVFGSWFVFAGDAPGLADAAPQPRVVAALTQGLPEAAQAPEGLLPDGLAATTPFSPAGPDGPLDPTALGFLVAGFLLLLAGLVLARWLLRPRPEAL